MSQTKNVAPVALAGLVVLAALALALSPAPAGVAPGVMPAAALSLFAIGFWATGVLPEHLTALIFFLLAMLFAVAPPEVAFAGFQSAAWWLVLGGLFIGLAVQRTGLGERIAVSLMRLFGGSYSHVLAGLAVVSVALAFIMPSTMGRVLILIPVVNALAERLGFAPGSRGRNGMVLTATLATFTPACAILPANVANIVLAGAAENLHGITLTYGSYLLLQFPVTGVLKTAAVVALAWLLFHDKVRGRRTADRAAPRLSADEWRLSLILAVALALWMSDFLHGINAAWVALGAAVVCLLPRIGVLPSSVFHQELRVGPLFYVAGILGMGQVVATSGVGDIMGRFLIDLVEFVPGADAYNFGALVVASVSLLVATSVPGLPAVLSPLAEDIAGASGLPLLTVLMTQAIGYSTVIFPYQLPPLVVAMQMGGVRLASCLKITGALLVVTLVVLTPINYLWWRWLGYLG
ncbi:MAG: SLC13 family permease [Alphaproteobacteria bacterium]